MSSLSNQLNSIKLSQNSLKIGAYQQQPSILFDSYTARSTSVDTIYSMALLAYDKLSSSLSHSLDQVQNRQEVLSEQMKELNRNTLTKEENNKLSRKLERFIIQLAPFLLNAECQHILQYMLRNFKINVFQAEVLALSMLQYWNFEIYQKVIGNISKKQMTGKLIFLNQMISDQQINFSFIIKHLTYSHAILDKLISIVLQASLLQIKSSKDEMINLGQSLIDQDSFLKHPLKSFLMKIFLFLIKDKRTSHYKYIIDFCTSCLRVKYPQEKEGSTQLVSMVLTILVNLIFQGGVSDQFLTLTIKKLLRKFVVQSNAQVRFQTKFIKHIFDFVMLVWQKKAVVIDRDIIQTLSAQTLFQQYFQNFNSSKYMVFYHLFGSICSENIKCQNLLESIGLNVKSQEFYRLYESQFLNSIFGIYQRTQNQLGKINIQWIRNFIKKVFKHEYGQWVNEQIKKKQLQITLITLKHIFETNEIDPKNRLILVQKIPKTKPLQKKKPELTHYKLQSQKRMIEQDQQESDKQYESTSTKQSVSKKLIQFLRKKGISSNDQQVDFENVEVAQKCAQLFYEYYETSKNKNEKINIHQKHLILEKLSTTNLVNLVYSLEMIQHDLEHEQFTTPIKYLIQKQSNNLTSAFEQQFAFGFLQLVFSTIINRKSLLENIIFRELLRLTINNLILPLAQAYYKRITLVLCQFYKKMMASCKQSLFQMVQTNALILKLSQRVFGHIGNSKGKYQNILHNHCKVLSLLINSMDSNLIDQKRNTPVISHQLIQMTYNGLVKIFGKKQLYLINIGVVQLITRKEMNYKQLKYFIDDVIIKELNYQQQERKQSEIGLDYYQHALSIGKSLIFATYMMGNTNQQWVNSIDKNLTSGIAKNQLAVFYGLIKDKLKRNIARKIFLFLKLNYQSKKFVQGFKNYLTYIDKEQMEKVLHIYSQLYYILLSLDTRKDLKVQSVLDTMLGQITNLFPLDLRLILFQPLLPNPKLYSYLSQQLQIHHQANYPSLSQLINIQVDQLSNEYISFVKECLKRGHELKEDVVQALFTNEHFLSKETNFRIYAELVCYLAEYDQHKLLPFVNQAMNVVLALCAIMMGKNSQQTQNYCLALVYRIVIQLKQLVEPFVGEIFKYALQSQSQFVQKFIEDTVQHLAIPTLIDTVKTLSKTTKHFYNFGIFFKCVSAKGAGHLLSKTLQYFASKTIHSAVHDEVILSNLYELQADIFIEMSLKFNQNELRKILIDFVRWSETKQTQEVSIPFNMRKIVISVIFSKLSSTLGTLFTPFYGYVFDSYLHDFQAITQLKSNTRKSGKRLRIQSDFSDKTTLLYLQYILKSLGTLFTNDTDNQFLDGTKFDILSERLSNLYIIQRLEDVDYLKMTNVYLSDCLLKLCRYLKDDYQLKSLNLKILLLLRIKNSRIQQAIFTFMDKLIDQIQDRYLIFINDLVPFLTDNIHNRNENVKRPIKSIINKVEEMSGSKIQNYMK